LTSSHSAAVIFDVDGTLVDSNDAHARAWIQAFAEHEITVTYESVRRAIGLPEPDVALHRIEATLLGAALALAVHVSAIRWRRIESEPKEYEDTDEDEARAGRPSHEMA